MKVPPPHALLHGPAHAYITLGTLQSIRCLSRLVIVPLHSHGTCLYETVDYLKLLKIYLKREKTHVLFSEIIETGKHKNEKLGKIVTRKNKPFYSIGPSNPPPCEQISICRIFRPLYIKTRKTYKADIYQPNSKYSKDFRNNIQTHSHISNGLGSPLKVSDLFKNGKLFSVFRIFRTLIPQDAKVAQPSRSSMSKSFM